MEDCPHLVRELSENHVPYEFHVFEIGEHGLSLGGRLAGYEEKDLKRLGNTVKWTKLAVRWLRNQFDC